MEILIQRKLCWLDPVPSLIMKECNQINLLSKEGQATSIPVQFLTASSPFLNSILTMPSFSCESITTSISIPSATSSTLQLLSQILTMGETDESRGLETTMTNMNELKNIFALLGMNAKLCPKLSSSKLAIKAVPYSVAAAVRDEVLMFEDVIGEMEAQNDVGPLNKKKSSNKNRFSSGKSWLLKKENIIRNLSEDENDIKESCEEFDTSCKVEQRSDNVKFKQSGLLRDFKVNLVDCTSEGTLKENAMSKKCAAKGERSLIMCNICGVEVNKYAGLRRHYREKHGIQDEKSASKVIKPSVNKCPKCDKKFSFRSSLLKHLKRVHKNEILTRKGTVRNVHHQEVHKSKKESEVCTKMEVMSNEILSKRKECNECEASFNHNSSLRRHKRRFHEGKTFEPYGCGECDLSFKNKSSIRRHKTSIHEGKTYGCGVCDKITAYRNGMIRHCTTSGHDKDLLYIIADLP